MFIAGGCCGWAGGGVKRRCAGDWTLGAQVVSGLRFVCSDMWRPYLNVRADKASHALHVLDRFHSRST